jgi:hypothetical protein
MVKPPPTRPPPGNERAIVLFFHCTLCADDPSGPLPSDIECGWTTLGFQVWCRRHDCNIIHVDFQGNKLPANLTRKGLRVVKGS